MNKAVYEGIDTTTKGKLLPRIVLGRPRWTNLALVLSLIIFWAGVILKVMS
jgi:hypothetical protein